jgi:ABC-type transporter Mla MlaB component
MTILALVCFLVVGAAAASILGRDSVPTLQFEGTGPAVVAKGPAANREGKKDKLPLAMAALPPAADNLQQLPEQLRQAFASDSPLGPQPPKIAAPSSIPLAADKPKAAAKPAVQKSYALLSDIQIAGIKERLKLSVAQEQHWPAVETALRAIARKIHATRQANPAATGAPIDPDSSEVSQLKSAAMPLLIQLREDQKREVRMLARIIGLEKVASQI